MFKVSWCPIYYCVTAFKLYTKHFSCTVLLFKIILFDSISGAGPAVDTPSSSGWTRPPLSEPIDADKEKIVFQQIDIDYYIGLLGSHIKFHVSTRALYT